MTDLGITRTADTVTITSSTGTSATISAADASNAGILTRDEKGSLTSSLTAVHSQAALDAAPKTPIAAAAIVLQAFGSYGVGDLLMYDHTANAWKIKVEGRRFARGGEISLTGYSVGSASQAGRVAFIGNNNRLQVYPLNVYDELIWKREVYAKRQLQFGSDGAVIEFTGGFTDIQSDTFRADFTLKSGTLPGTGAIGIKLLEDLSRLSALRTTAIDPSESQSDREALSAESVADSIEAYPRAWTGKAYAAGLKATYAGDVWESNQTVPLHEPPPNKSAKWTRQTPTRLKSEALSVSDLVFPKFANITNATATTVNLVWEQGSINEDVIDIDSNGIGTAQVAYTGEIGPGTGSGLFWNFNVTFNFTGTSTGDFVVTPQVSYNSGTWTGLGADSVKRITASEVTSGAVREDYFALATTEMVNAADSSTLQWRVVLTVPAGITLSSWSFVSVDAGSDQIFKYTANVAGDEFELFADAAGNVKLLKPSDDTETQILKSVASLPTATPQKSDGVAISDTSDSDANKQTTIEDLTELAPTWVGNRRQNSTSSTVNTSSGIASLLTNSITPSRAGALIRVRGTIYGGLATAPSANGRTTFYARMKKGTGNYTGMSGSNSYTQIGGHIDKNSDYLDWVQQAESFEYMITAADTDVIKVNIFGRPRVANTDQSSMYFNRNVNNTLDGEMVSFLELAEFKHAADLNPISVTTVSSADSA